MSPRLRRVRRSGPHEDHEGRTYAIEGGMGTEVNGTRARIWIKCFSRSGGWLPSRSIRLDVKTAREFHAALGRAIERAETELAMYNAEVMKINAITQNPL